MSEGSGKNSGQGKHSPGRVPGVIPLCIAGTDTDAGKTMVAAALLLAAQRLGLRPMGIKPVQSGCLRMPERKPERALERVLARTPERDLAMPGPLPDWAEHGNGGRADLQGRPEDGDGSGIALNAPDVAVYLDACPEAEALALVLLEEASSPHLAAAHEGLRLEASALARAVTGRLEAAVPGSFAVIESAGGVMTPLNDEETMLDLFAALGFPVLLVTANRLGAINQTLLAAAALRSRNIPLAGLVLTRTTPLPPPSATERGILADNGPAISHMGRLPLWAKLPYLEGLHSGVAVERRTAWEQAAARMTPLLAGFAGSLLQDGGSAFARTSGGIPGRAETAAFVAERDAATSVVKAEPLAAPYAEPLAAPPAEPLAAPPAGREAGAPSGRLTGPQTGQGGELSGEELLRFDREHIWHPYTSALHPLPVREAVGTKGTRIFLADGRELVDGMSSWWCAIHGYNHPRLLEALRAQAASMPHVMFGGLTHKPAATLAKRLLDMAPEGLEHVFFADSGSVAVEVALKMALQYQKARGKRKKDKLLALRGGYHGDTLGAMSVCDPETGMHSLFSGILPGQIFAPRPECRFDAPYDPSSAGAFEEILCKHAGQIAAVILEPVVQGAGGMWFYHPEYLRRVAELCKEHDCLLILDEIATGFGRTGKLFACHWAGVRPDILCLGKALTGGVMTLSATLASGRVARGISAGGGVLMHGPTFMGNPLACAVAGASLSLLEEDAGLVRVSRLEARIRQGFAACAGLPGVVDLRVLGAIGVVEMERPVNVEKVQQYCMDKHGCWIRPFGRNMYIMPPFVASDEDIDRLSGALRGVLEDRIWE